MDDIHKSFKDDLFREIFVFISVLCNALLFQHFELELSVEYSDILVALMLCNSFDNSDDVFLELVENVVSIYYSFFVVYCLPVVNKTAYQFIQHRYFCRC